MKIFKMTACLLSSLPLLLPLVLHAEELEEKVTRFRVCADPFSLPSSNKEQMGFENKIAKLFADDLGVPLEFEWFPQRIGFIRNTLRNNDTPDESYKCDIVMGVVDNFEMAATTKPYFHSTWSMVYIKGRGLDSIKSQEDLMNVSPALKEKSAAVIFFTGERNQEVAPNDNTNGNPVLGVYLQGDVYEMNRITEGSWRYFHKRIKFALADDAKVEAVTITVDGKELKAKKVTIVPYENDPKRKMFEEYADKVYEITVSEDVPGMLYEIRTVIPSGKKTDDVAATEPLVVETLSYAGIDYE